MNRNQKEKFYQDQNGKCAICERVFSIEFLDFQHIISENTENNKVENNLLLVCPECSRKLNFNLPFREVELIYFIRELINKNKDFRSAEFEQIIPNSNNYQADILVETRNGNAWKKLLIELKSTVTFTEDRLESLIKILKSYTKQFDQPVTPVLAFPGLLPDIEKQKLKDLGIEIWDKEFITEKFKKEIRESKNLIFKYYFSHKSNLTFEEKLIDDLENIKPGKKEWSKFQKHVEKILSYLFSDILSDPITELSDNEKINRRDFILRNYCDNGFWKYLREKYQADFIVLDAKNYVDKIKKNQILQISNYLKTHGTGLFAIIISRSGEENNGSYFTRREKWVTEKKMIIILNDEDLKKMILSKASSNNPEEIIVQKIEDFRLKM